MATVSELRQQAKARKIPKYSRMNKSQLMGALGVTNQSARPLGDARARSTAKQHGIAKTYAADKLSSKLGGSDEAKRVAIKQRIVKSVSKELKAHEKKIGRKLTIEEKRSVAVKALASEVRAIRSGKLSSDEIRTTRTANIKRLQKEGKLPPSELSKDEIRTAREANLKRLQKEKAKKAKADKFVPQHEQEAIAAKADSKAKKGKKTAAEILAKNRADHLADPKSQELMMNFRAHAERTRAARKAAMERSEKNEPKNESKKAEAAVSEGFMSRDSLNSAPSGSLLRQPAKFISSRNQASTPEHSELISSHLKRSGKNVSPVYLHESSEGKLKALHNGHIVEAAKKGKHDFVHAIVVPKSQQEALNAEKAVHSRVLDPSKVSKSAESFDKEEKNTGDRFIDRAFAGIQKGQTSRIPAKFISTKEKSGATPEELRAISDHMKKNGKNVMPVFVRQTGDDKYEAVHNGHILEAAKKGKHDFVQTIVLDEKMHKQLQAEQKH